MRCRTANEFWSFAQRYLAFEEPADRFTKLKRLLAKQLGKPDRLPAKASLFELDQLFSQVYSDETLSAEVVTFNIGFALEDVKKFKPVAFDLWLAATCPGTDLRSADLQQVFALAGYAPPPTDFASAVSQKDMRPSVALWLYRAASAGPNWNCLKESGPWSGDARATLVEDFMGVQSAEWSWSADQICALGQQFADCVKRNRLKLPGNFLPKILLLVEGATEALLLPHFSRSLGFDLAHNAVALEAAGGANQVMRKYVELAETVEVPIVVVLDADAISQAELLRETIRAQDGLYVLSRGEIEDSFDLEVLRGYLNRFIGESRLAAPISSTEIDPAQRRTVALDRLWRKRGLGDFDKIGFAQNLISHEMRREDVPQDAEKIVKLIAGVLHEHGRSHEDSGS